MLVFYNHYYYDDYYYDDYYYNDCENHCESWQYQDSYTCECINFDDDDYVSTIMSNLNNLLCSGKYLTSTIKL